MLWLWWLEIKSHSFSWRRKWEIDFVRFLLGFTTQREEVEFSRMTEDQMKLRTVEHSVTKLIRKGMTNILRHRGHWFKDEMDAKGAIPMNLLLDNLRGRQSPTDQCAAGRIFASLLNGNDKQRFYVDIYLSEVWYPQREHMPWSIYIGCHQGHSTGLVVPAQVSHPLTPVECFALGWIFHTTDRRFQDSIYQKGLVRRGRDALHFMYVRMMVEKFTFRKEQEQENPGDMIQTFMLPWISPWCSTLSMICSWLPMVLFLSLMICLLNILSLLILSHIWATTSSIHRLVTHFPEKFNMDLRDQEWLQCRSTWNTCHQTRYPSMTMENWLNPEFPETLRQREGKQLGNSWDKNLQLNTLAASTSFLKEQERKHLQAQHQLRLSMWRLRLALWTISRFKQWRSSASPHGIFGNPEC